MSSVHGSSVLNVTLICDTRFVINNVSVSLVSDYLRFFSWLVQNNGSVIPKYVDNNKNLSYTHSFK